MNNFKILADSCCDIPNDLLKQIDVDIIPFYTCLDGKNHLRERIDISVDDFYDRLIADKNLFPNPSPLEAHLTIPAISVNSNVVGTKLLG